MTENNRPPVAPGPPLALPDVLDFMQLLWAVVHGLERSSKGMASGSGRDWPTATGPAGGRAVPGRLRRQSRRGSSMCIQAPSPACCSGWSPSACWCASPLQEIGGGPCCGSRPEAPGSMRSGGARSKPPSPLRWRRPGPRIGSLPAGSSSGSPSALAPTRPHSTARARARNAARRGGTPAPALVSSLSIGHGPPLSARMVAVVFQGSRRSDRDTWPVQSTTWSMAKPSSRFWMRSVFGPVAAILYLPNTLRTISSQVGSEA